MTPLTRRLALLALGLLASLLASRCSISVLIGSPQLIIVSCSRQGLAFARLGRLGLDDRHRSGLGSETG